MSRFAPVFLRDDRRLNGRVSQTFLRHYNGCPRSAFLYAQFKGEASTPAMERGKGLHAICERATRAALEQDEPVIPPEVVKAIADEVLADPEFAIPVEEHDAIREMSYRWASETAFDPGAVVALESLFVLDLAGFQVRCKIDYAQLLEDGAAVYVADYKSSKAAPTLEDVSRKRPDDTRAAKNFQLILYALVLAYGVPVRVEEEPCGLCGDTGFAEDVGVPVVGGCTVCDGRRVIRYEVPEPFPVASRAQRFDLEFVYPAIEDREGKMLRRGCDLSRRELDEYRASFEGLLARVAHSEESGDWPAVVSDMACNECPASTCCPIPSELRDHRGAINTVEQCAEVAELQDRIAAESTAIRREIKAFCKAHGIDLRYGGKVWEFVPVERVKVDRDALIAAARRAAEYGDPFDPADYTKVSIGTDFKSRDLTADEMAEEGSNG